LTDRAIATQRPLLLRALSARTQTAVNWRATRTGSALIARPGLR
jgi:hypothetical protein